MAVLVAVACLAGLVVAVLEAFSSPGPAAPASGTPGTGAGPVTGTASHGARAGAATRPVPIASVAKVMTAYVVLHDPAAP